MQSLNDSLKQLINRLPELEWKINQLGTQGVEKKLPKGLFRKQAEFSIKACLQEIKMDLKLLSNNTGLKAQEFLATQVKRKIDCLVHLYHTQTVFKTNCYQETVPEGSISTLQQWLLNLENGIIALKEQQLALANRLAQLERHRGDSETILCLKAEIGQVERQLTLAEETYRRAMTVS